MKTIFFLMSVCLALPTWARWDLNDVSYLMPLPQSILESGLLNDRSAGPLGALLPTRALEKLPHLTSPQDPDHSDQGLQVMAVRIDPCFPLPTPQQCQKQIRIVWQPLHPRMDGGVRTIDASLHSFYVLNDRQFLSLLQDLKAWKNQFQVSTTGLPLQRHPAWQSDQDASLQAFNQILLKYAGDKNISRATVMALRSKAMMWGFTGIDFDANGAAHAIAIPRLNGAVVQNFVNMDFPFDEFTGGFAPKPSGADTISKIPRDSRAMLSNPELLTAEIGAVFRFENPNAFSPETMDCMSCHIAQAAKAWALSKHSRLKLDTLWDANIYKNSNYNLTNVSPIWRTNNLRSFGYFDREPAISQRVINESAAVADALNVLLP